MADQVPEVMTPADAAEWLQVSVRTLEDWRAANVGPPFSKVRQTVRYRRSMMETWMAVQERPDIPHSARIGLADTSSVRVSFGDDLNKVPE